MEKGFDDEVGKDVDLSSEYNSAWDRILDDDDYVKCGFNLFDAQSLNVNNFELKALTASDTQSILNVGADEADNMFATEPQRFTEAKENGQETEAKLQEPTEAMDETRNEPINLDSLSPISSVEQPVSPASPEKEYPYSYEYEDDHTPEGYWPMDDGFCNYQYDGGYEAETGEERQREEENIGESQGNEPTEQEPAQDQPEQKPESKPELDPGSDPEESETEQESNRESDSESDSEPVRKKIRRRSSDLRPEPTRRSERVSELEAKRIAASPPDPTEQALKYSAKFASSFSCNLCRDECALNISFEEFLDHIYTSHQNYYRCNKCSTDFQTWDTEAIVAHWGEAHDDLVMEYEILSKVTLVKRKQPLTPWWCPMCIQPFPCDSLRNTHMKTDCSVVKARQGEMMSCSFTCKVCGGSYFRKEEVELHVVTKHPRLFLKAPFRYDPLNKNLKGRKFREPCEQKRLLLLNRSRWRTQGKAGDKKGRRSKNEIIIFCTCDICNCIYIDEGAIYKHLRMTHNITFAKAFVISPVEDAHQD